MTVRAAALLRLRFVPHAVVSRSGTRAGWSAALGNGGQLILVIPERDLVIVVTTGLYDDPRWRSAIGQIPPTIADSLAR